MSQPFLAQIQIFSFDFAPRGWAQCNGQLLPIAQNQALFSLLGTTYGGNGTTTFALPDLRSRVPMHWGGSVSLGERSGVENVTLLLPNLPAHTHNALASSSGPTVGGVTSNAWATGGAASYSPNSNAVMNPAAIGNAGATQPHPNMQPTLVLNICIALQGIFPSRN